MSGYGFRLSPEQRRLWSADRHPPDYYAQCAIDIDGDFDPLALHAGVRRIVDRHDSLRTRFQQRAGLKVPLQVIEPDNPPTWAQFDLCACSDVERESVIRERLQDQRTRLADASRKSPVDVVLLKLGPQFHVVGICAPAICVDAESLVIVMNEIGEALTGCSQRQPAADAELAQYVQFSEWQNESLEQEESREGLEYWKTKILPAPRPFGLCSCSAKRETAWFITGAILTDALTACIRDAAAKAGEASAGEVVLACWQIVLGRLIGESGFAIGYVRNGRKFEELAGTVGLLAKTLPIAGSFRSSERYVDLLRRIVRSVRDADEWQEYFADAAGDWHRAFVTHFESVQAPDVEGKGLRIRLRDLAVCRDLQRLKLTLVDRGKSIELKLQFDPDVMERVDADCLLSQLIEVLGASAENVETSIAALQTAGSFERKRDRAINESGRKRVPADTVIERFQKQVFERRDAVAVVAEETQISYSELDRRAACLACRIADLGVSADDRVALWLDRSADAIVALIAVLKAGAAYVPLDPAWPAARRATLLKAVGASALVTTRQHADEMELPSDVRVLVVDEQSATVSAFDGSPRRIQPEQLAYVLFTSGSTGQPKAVGVEHRQIAAYVDAIASRFPELATGRCAHVSSLSADLGYTTLYPPLCGGGCVHLISSARVTDPDAFAAYMASREIECLKIVPTHLTQLLSTRDASNILPRRLLLLGGEASSWRLIDEVRRLKPACRISNHYGPTETCVGAAVLELDPKDFPHGSTPPLGFPLADSELHIVDEEMGHLATWRSGELFIGGDGVARGYVSDPALTAERFIPDWNSDVPGKRLYRTGDCVRRHADGSVEFLGRFDRQVKIRGFRIEPGEVEAALRQHPDVQEAVAMVAQGAEGIPRLFAYVVASETSIPEDASLRAFLQARVPPHLVPSAFVFVPAFPLTSNGKVDRDALAMLRTESKSRRRSPITPRTFGEEMLAGLWREVLGVQELSMDDNFFALGGDSLVAIQLASRIRKAFGIEMPVRSLLESPTVAAMAGVLDELCRGDGQSQRPPLVAARGSDRKVMSFGQERLWVLQQLEPQSAAYNSIAPLRLTGDIDGIALQQSFKELVRRHEVLRTKVFEELGKPFPEAGDDAGFAVPVIDLRGLPSEIRQETARKIAVADSDRPFDLKNEFPARAKWLRLSKTEQVLLVIAHHIAWDGWSQSILVRELTTFYKVYRRGAPSEIPELAVQYHDYSRWQRDYLRGDVLEGQLAYWRQHLEGSPDETGIPSDHPRPAVPSFAGGLVEHFTSAQTLSALKELGRRQGATLFMSALAGLYALLFRYTGQTHLVVGTDVANRSPIETEPLIGFFVNNIPLHVSLDGEPSFRELLQRVRDCALGAYAHQEVPFATLVKSLSPRRVRSRTPIFQVLFVLQNFPGTAQGPGSLDIGFLDVPFKTSKFDLALFVSEGADGGLTAHWIYSADLYDESTIRKVAKDYDRLLESLSALPDVPVYQHGLTDLDHRQERAYAAKEA